MRLKTTFLLLWCLCQMQAQEKVMMLAGTYTDGGSKGIYSYYFNQKTGEAEALNSLALKNPSYLTISRDGRLVYAVSETNDERSRSIPAEHAPRALCLFHAQWAVPALLLPGQ